MRLGAVAIYARGGRVKLEFDTEDQVLFTSYTYVKVNDCWKKAKKV